MKNKNKACAAFLVMSAFHLSAFAVEGDNNSNTQKVNLTSGDSQTYPKSSVQVFLDLAEKMTAAARVHPETIEKIGLDPTDFNKQPTEIQFDQISKAIKDLKSDDEKKAVIGDIFGKDNVEILFDASKNSKHLEGIRDALCKADRVFTQGTSTQASLNYPEFGRDDAFGVFINPVVGTLGVGVDVGYEFNRYFKLRAHYGTGSLSHNAKISQGNYNFKWENEDNFGLFLDWHPRGHQFRVSVGALHSNPNVYTETNYRGNLSLAAIGGANYDVHSDYILDCKWANSTQPYIGVGWSTDGAGKRIAFFSLDVGVAYMGHVDSQLGGEAKFFKNGTRITKASALAIIGNPSSTPEEKNTAQGDLAALANLSQFDENVRDILGDVSNFLENFNFYPVIQIGVGIRF